MLVGCGDDNQIPDDIAAVPVTLAVDRFDRQFIDTSAYQLDDLMQAYPYLFPGNFTDDFWAEKRRDTLQQELGRETAQVFKDFSEERVQLENLFKHIKYYYPDYELPQLVTLTSEVDYRNRVILTDSLLLIALDTYLGSEHRFYGGIQRYFADNFRREQIVVDVAQAFAEKKINRKSGVNTFLDEMIYFGKILYLKERLLTLIPENEIIGYSIEHTEWARKNEVNIWTYFVDKELLFDTDRKLLQRFINPGPFSKFYMDFDSDSPPRLGRYIGWQIVKKYMENTEIPLQQLNHKSTEEIFKQANYKPRK